MYLLTRLAIWKRWITFLVVLAVIGVAIHATLQLKMELIPDIEFPAISVVNVYPGAPPEKVASDLTAPVEAAISRAKEPDEIISTSSQNMSFIIALYDFGTDMDKVTADTSKNLEGLQLPQGAQPPRVFSINMGMLPEVILNLSGDLPPSQLREIALSQIAPKLEEIEGVYSVEVEGGEEQATIAVDPDKMTQLGISIAQLAGIIASREYSSLEEIENTPLALPGARIPTGIPRIGDIATVNLGLAPGTPITRTNGEPSVSIMVSKESDANTVVVANAVIDEANRIQQELGEKAHLFTILDQSEYIEQSISDLIREAIVGGILAIVVIYLFLMVFRASLVTALSIPLSILIGFLAMRYWGITINILTLSAMAIVVGRVVDDSIVMLEVIFRYMRQGESFKEAAINGAREVAMPITSATIATVAIFIPLAFTGGMVGELFRPFALTLTFALMASLLVALMVVPPLCSFLGRRRVEERPRSREPWYQRVYVPALRWALTHRTLTLVIAAVLTIGSLALIPFIGTSFLPSTSEAMITVEIEMPAEAGQEATAAKVAQVEELIADNLNPLVYDTSVGTSASLMGGLSSLMGGGSDVSTIMVRLAPDADPKEEAARLRQLVARIADESEITISSGMHEGGMGGFSSSSLRITVTGEDPSEVTQTANAIEARLQNLNGLTDIENDAADVLLQPEIRIDPAGVVRSGLDPERLQQELSMMLMGAPLSRVSLEGNTYNVALAPLLPALTSAEQMKRLKVGLVQTVNLEEITSVDLVPKPTYIRRVGEKRAIRITGTITDKDVGAVNQRVLQELDDVPTPPGGEVFMGGVAEEMSEAFRQMGIAIIVAIGISYLVMVITLRSVLNPFVIMFSLPLASVGALLGLFLTGRPLGISALMGSLMLVGIVLTNAIVLISLVEQLRRSGHSTFDALLEGGSTRLRPILMTALTTMIALVPLALGFGEGTIIAAELATVVIGGLFTSTLLTLLVVPVIYSLVESVRQRFVARGSHR